MTTHGVVGRGDISDWIAGWARRLPSKPAIRCGEESIGYAELAQRIDRLAAGLRIELGVEQGDRVAFLGLNSPRMIELLFACSRIGAMFVPLNWRLTESELSLIIRDAEPLILVTEQEFRSTAEALRGNAPRFELVDCDDMREIGRSSSARMDSHSGDRAPSTGVSDLPLLLCYTSGTTGKPKGAMLTQGALLWNAINATQMHDLTSADRILTATPMFHVGGLNIQTLPALHAGATVTLHRRFDPEAFFDTVESERTTLIQLVPTQWNALMAHPRWATADLTSLRLAVTGSTLVPSSLSITLRERGLDLIQVYGSTETGPIAVYSGSDEARRIPLSAGRPAIHCDVRIVDDNGLDIGPDQPGEILVRGANIMRGYWRDPATTAEVLRDGWFHTGDIGHFDAEGNVFIDDRKKDLIVSGGENIYPAALEAILLESTDIAEAAVVGRSDPHWGETVVAVVVRRPGSTVTAEDVVNLLRDRVARYKMPRTVMFVDSLPRSGSGKLIKGEIRKMVAAAALKPASATSGLTLVART
jgi:fatty-acyl-CoA synthase